MLLCMNLLTFHKIYENNNINLKFQNNFQFILFRLYVSQPSTLLSYCLCHLRIKRMKMRKIKNKILILTILATVDYYSTRPYEKIPCSTFSLNWNSYFTELLLQNHPKHVQSVIQRSLTYIMSIREAFFWQTPS